MNILHTSKHFDVFEPKLNIEENLLHVQNVLDAFDLVIKEGEAEELLRSLIKLIAYARLFNKEDALPLSVAHIMVSSVYTIKKDYWKQGEFHASECVLHAENVPTCKEQLNILTEGYYMLSYNRLKLGKVGEASEAASAAKSCIEELKYLGYSPSDPDLPYKISVLSAWSSPSKPSILEESLNLKGPPEKNVYIHLMISNFHQANGDPTEALKSAKAAFEQANEFDDLAMQADATRCLGVCFLDSPGHGCAEEGLETLKQAVALYTTQFTGLNPVALSTNDLIINALIKQEKYEEAVEELKAVKEAKVLKFGDYSKEMSDFYKQLGSLYLILNRQRQALSTFKQCLAILNVIQAKPNSVTVSVRDIIKSLEANKSVRPMFKLY